ncbi:MAG: ATP-NAD/AcoX kinase [uncultured bacterium]|nr:MAG: ATP-NAD/AcoX kinase [uncultured bacterium]
MKVVISGLAKQELAAYIRKHYRHDIQIVKQKPEFVLCYGGDGTLLFAERNYPTVPKVMIRHSRVCTLCARLARETILRLLVRGQYSLLEQPLLETSHRRKTMYGINDIMVAHGQINTGLRYHLWLNGESWGDELLGDGVVVATPLGSTGYYQSITRSTFQQGMGIAFNNSILSVGNIVVPEDTVVKVRVNRGPAVVAADNNDHFFPLQARDVVTIRRSHRSTYVVYFAGKHYRKFNVGIGESRMPLGFCQMCGKPMVR